MKSTLKVMAGAVVALAITTGTQAETRDSIVYALTTTNISVGNAIQSSVPLAAGYWEEEDLDVEVIGLAGTTMGVQQILAGQVHFATAGPEALMMARERGVPIVSVYVLAHTPIYETVVLAESDIHGYEDLRGKTIGFPDMASGVVQYARAALRSVDVDPETETSQLVAGLGSTAAHAFRQGEIDAWAVWDTGIAALENAGFEFRKIDPDWLEDMVGTVLITHEDIARDQPELVVKFLRGIAKATAFALANPEATIRNHWEMYPATQPDTVSDDTFAESLHIFNSRMDRMRKSDDVRWGEHVDDQWVQVRDYSVREDLLGEDFELEGVYTNEFLDDVNDFDEDAIVESARNSDW